MSDEPKTGTEKYLHSSIMTAGKIKSVQMLVDKAYMLLEPITARDLHMFKDDIRRCRNIIAQLEMSLNLKNGETAVSIFQIYETVYEALEHPTNKSLDVARYLLQDFSKTLKMKFG